VSNYRYQKPDLRKRNDPVEQWGSYLESGYYRKYELKLVSVSKVSFDSRNQGRFDRVMAAIEDGIALPPVELSWDGRKYTVADGNHRIWASDELGYTKVPAVVGSLVYEAPPGNPPPGVEKRLMEGELMGFLARLRHELSAMRAWAWALWGGASSDGYRVEMEIDTDGNGHEEKGILEVRAGSGDRRKAEFECCGKTYRGVSGDWKVLAKDFAKWLRSQQF